MPFDSVAQPFEFNQDKEDLPGFSRRGSTAIVTLNSLVRLYTKVGRGRSLPDERKLSILLSGASPWSSQSTWVLLLGSLYTRLPVWCGEET